MPATNGQARRPSRAWPRSRTTMKVPDDQPRWRNSTGICAIRAYIRASRSSGHHS
jgi:hypothetical protein